MFFFLTTYIGILIVICSSALHLQAVLRSISKYYLMDVFTISISKPWVDEPSFVSQNSIFLVIYNVEQFKYQTQHCLNYDSHFTTSLEFPVHPKPEKNTSYSQKYPPKVITILICFFIICRFFGIFFLIVLMLHFFLQLE